MRSLIEVHLHLQLPCFLCTPRTTCGLCLPPGITVADEYCLDVPPAKVETCNNFVCTFQFVIGQWSECDNECGGGHR